MASIAATTSIYPIPVAQAADAASKAKYEAGNQSETDSIPEVVNSVLVVGDSLSAEYGLSRGTGWVALLEARISERGWTPANLPKPASVPPTIVNASISGETTAGGLSRLPELLAKHRPATVVIALGGNDALRGLDIAASERNLGQMIELAQRAGARVLLAGMMVPPNYGRNYGEQFFAIYQRLAQRTGVALVPFLLDGFAEDMAMFQPDRIHPLASAHPRILDNVWPAFAKLGRAKAAPNPSGTGN